MDRNILIIAGEPSGDVRASELLKELKPILPGVRFWGVGGDHMERRGVELIEHIRRLSIVGVWEAIRKLPVIRRQYAHVTANIRKRKPQMAILIDYPGFNLKVAKFLRRENIPVIYYVIPQVWAWGSGRIKTLERCVDKALVLFKFEEKLLAGHGIDCVFTGHPLVDKAPEITSPAGRKEGCLTIALLPGSRETEISNMFPVMMHTAEILGQRLRDVRFIVAKSSNIKNSSYDSVLAEHSGIDVTSLTDNTFAVLDRSDLAIVTSGTATLETTVMEKPMVIVYRAAFLTYILVRMFIKVSFLGMVNILAGEEIVPELYQDDVTPEKLSRKVLDIIEDEPRMREMEEKLKKIKNSLGGKGASRRAAEAIAQFAKELPIRSAR